jgi:TetR/AcrR family fatty acid metabolism transcriptional regulator
MKKSGRLPAESRIAEILTGARALMAERGHENFTPLDVAVRCSVSEATIYKYFPSKRDLLLRAAEAWMEDMLAAVPKLPDRGDVFERLRLAVRHSLTVVREEPALTRYVLLELRSDPAYRETKFYELNRKFYGGLRSVIADAIATGLFREDVSPRLVRNMISGCIEHQTWAYLRGQGDFSVDDTAEEIAGIVYRGVAKETFRERRQIGRVLDAIEEEAKGLEERAAALRERIQESRRVGAAAPASAAAVTKRKSG